MTSQGIRILRGSTPPYTKRIVRRHAPRAARGGPLTYDRFKDCLRWEFGFTCAVCLLHERHFVFSGTNCARTGQTTVEHFVLKSTAEGVPLEHDYSNCLFMCRLCNLHRGDRHPHVRADGARLLNPADHVWAEHFQVNADRLDPLPGDADAAYTEAAYGINDGDHTVRRRQLASLLLGMIDDQERDIAKVAQIDIKRSQPNVSVDTLVDDQVERGRLVQQILSRREALKDFFSGIPMDAPKSCRCTPPNLSVPVEVEEGWQSIPDIRPPPAPSPSSPKRRFRTG